MPHVSPKMNLDEETTNTTYPGIWRWESVRLRERFMEDRSFEKFNDAEILETLLSYELGPLEAADAAKSLLDSFGSLKGVFEARPEQLMSVNGINNTAASLVAMAVPLAKAWIRGTSSEAERISSTSEAKRYCRSLLIGERVEKYYVIALSNRHKILGKRLISIGSLSEVEAYPRLVVETALNYNALYVILCHNHPGGTCEASENDVSNTLTVQKLFDAMGIHVIDHIIVAGNETYSMLENGDISLKNENITKVVISKKKNASADNHTENKPESQDDEEDEVECSLIPFHRKAFGKIMNIMCVEAGLNREKISALTGIEQSYLVALEKGEKIVKLDELWEIAKAFNVEPWILVLRLWEECGSIPDAAAHSETEADKNTKLNK